MKLIDRYVFTRLLTSMFSVLLIVLSIDAIGEVVDQFGKVSGRYSFLEALYYVVLKIPGGLEEYLGFSALIGAMVGLGSFTSTGELTVIRATGYSILRIGWLVMKPALVMILLGAIVSEFVAPKMEQTAESRRDLLRGRVSLNYEDSGLWIYDQGAYVFMEAVYPDGKVFGVERYQIDDQTQTLIMNRSERADFDGSVWRQGDTGWSRVSTTRATSGHDVTPIWNTELTPELLNMSVLDADQMSIRDLHNYSHYLGSENPKVSEYKVQFWSKLLQPLSVATLVMVGISFVVGSTRQMAVGQRIFIGVIVGVVFRVMQDVLGPAATVWGFSPLLAVLIPIGITLVAGLAIQRLKRAS